MLRYTARYLLSRTLRTVLSRYLLDVDVDAVLIPIPYGGGGSSFDDSSSSAQVGGDIDGGGDGGRSDSEGGWGVRLSNVRPREGVELMTLPGTVSVRTKRKMKRRVARRRRRGGAERNRGVAGERQQQIQAEEGADTGGPSAAAAAAALDLDHPPVEGADRTTATVEGTRTEEGEGDDGYRDGEIAVERRGRAEGVSEEANIGVYLSPSPSFGEDSWCSYGGAGFHSRYPSSTGSGAGSSMMLDESYLSERSPPTPDQHGVSSWVCFSRSAPATTAGATGGERGGRRGDEQESSRLLVPDSLSATSSTISAGARAVPTVLPRHRRRRRSHAVAAVAREGGEGEAPPPHLSSRAPPDSSAVDGTEDYRRPPHTGRRGGSGGGNDEDGVVSSSSGYGGNGRGGPAVGGNGNLAGEEKEGGGGALFAGDEDEIDHGDGDEENGSSSSFEYVEEEEVVEEELAMVLKVGEGGRIGTLHVRIVGKDYHITIEDADLILDIVPKEGATKDNNAGEDGDDDGRSSSSPGKGVESGDDADFKDGKAGGRAADEASWGGGASAADDGARRDKKGTANDDGGEPSTTGDRVMKRNKLARYLAAVPNLYLRDCRIKVVVRDRPEDGGGVAAAEGEEGVANEQKKGDVEGGRKKNEGQRQPSVAGDEGINHSPTMFVLGIDFLSVTSGEDFLAHVRGGGGATADGDEADSKSAGSGEQYTAKRSDEYLSKRIRTGKGEGGGIWFQIVPPTSKRKSPYYSRRGLQKTPSYLADDSRRHGSEGASSSPRWAIRSFRNASNMCLLRFSGFDLHARILLGSKRERAVDEEAAAAKMRSDERDYYYDYDADLVLFGVDYVGIVDAPPEGRHDDAIGDKGDDVGDVNANSAIETIPIRSNFHRIARGMRRRGCPEHHLPSEDCPSCWSYCVGPKAIHGTKENDAPFETPKDSVLPLPGFVLYFAVTDPVEVNADRECLDSLHLLKSLFTSKQGRAVPEKAEEVASSSLPSTESAHITETTSEEMHWAGDETCAVSAGQHSLATDTLDESFPSFMKPESVQVIGVHVAKFVLRLHIMRDGDSARKEDGFSFGFWETTFRSVTVDLQQLHADELSFQDVNVELGHLKLCEMKGVCRKRLLSLGLEQTDCEDDDSSTSEGLRLCTASTILELAAPFGALTFLHRDGNALNLRFVQVPIPKVSHQSLGSLTISRCCMDLKFGPVDIEVPSDFFGEFTTATKEAVATLNEGRNREVTSKEPAPPSQPNSSKSKDSTSQSLLMEYSVQLHGGKVNIRPAIKCSFPSTRFSGQKSSTAGLVLHTLLHRVKVDYGQRPQPQHNGSTLPSQMAAVPEGVRLRILLFLDDLSPMEKAFGLKKAGNSFMRSHAINQKLKQISAAGAPQQSSKRRTTRKSKPKRPPKKDRKEQLIARLMKLDEETLEGILAAHES